MTVNQRNSTLMALLMLQFLLVVAVVVLFFRRQPSVGSGHVAALTGAALMTVAAGLVAATYLRIFRRSRSIPVFFMVTFFIFTMLDATKWVQLLVLDSPWPHYAATVSRVTIFGHLSGALALFGSGLYAGSHRLKWQGVAFALGLFLTASLSWAIPIDSSVMPENLVFAAGFPASLDMLTALLLILGVINYAEQAIVARDTRRAVTALSVLLIVVGRELLYHRTEIAMMFLGTGLFLAGGITYALRNYRDYLLG